MPNVNGGVLDGVRRIGLKVRDLVVDGGMPGAPLGFRIRGATIAGPPASGTWKLRDQVLDSNGVIWICVLSGSPGAWRRAGSPASDFYVDDYGAAGDGIVIPDVSVTNASAAFTTAGLSAPAAPTVSNAATGGTIPAGTYQAEVTLVNKYGETVASSSSSTTTSGATSTITVTAPTGTANATGWYAYVTQAGGSTYYRQQAQGSPSNLGVNLILTAPPTTSGATPPAANTTASVLSQADKGKAIMINGAQGTAAAPFLGTIASVTAAGTGGTLSGNAGVTTSGCPAVYGTDCTAAINACITAAWAWAISSGNWSVRIIFAGKIYMLSAAPTQLTSTVTYNAQIPVPYAPASGTTQKLVISFVGGGAGNGGQAQFWQSTVPNLAGTCLVSTQTAPSSVDGTYNYQSVIGGPSAGGAFAGSYANTKAILQGISVWCPAFTNMIAYDMAYLSACQIDACSANIFAPPQAGVHPWLKDLPPLGGFQSTHGVGLRMPLVGNNDDSYVSSFCVEGYETGLWIQDHFTAGRICNVYNDLAIFIDFAHGTSNQSHAVTIGQWSYEVVNGGIKSNAGSGAYCALDIVADGENTTISYDVSDTNGTLYGVLKWTDLNRSAPTITGAAKLKVVNNKLAPGNWSGAPAVPASTTAQQNTSWRDAAVTVTGGTVTAITVDGTVTGLTSGTVIVPGGKNITLTYSAAPSWVWTLL